MNLNEQLETVTVQTKQGPVRINKSEYDADPKAYKLAKAGDVAKSDDSEKPDGDDAKSEGIPADAVVSKVGDRFYVTSNGANVAADGLDHEAGYETDAAAWNALASARKPK